jgi:hypothetical protein
VETIQNKSIKYIPLKESVLVFTQQIKIHWTKTEIKKEASTTMNFWWEQVCTLELLSTL